MTPLHREHPPHSVRHGRRPAVAISLRRLLPGASFVGCADIHPAEATERSDECTPGMLFAAIRGCRVDGTRFVGDAVRRGAGAILTDRPLADVPVPQCIVSDVRRAYAELCAALVGHPSRRLGLAGVTGTNGKTTVTWLLRAILRRAGLQTGLIGTIEYDDGAGNESVDPSDPSLALGLGPSSLDSRLTTPDSKRLSSLLADMVARRTTHAAIELSSHALHQRRSAGTLLDVAIVTNVTQDHFDYHGDYDDYLASKARIFDHCKPEALVVLNADDAGSSSLREHVDPSLETLTFGIDRPADIRGRIHECTASGSRFELLLGEKRIDVTTPLVGRHNVSNCLAAAAAARHFGLSPEQIADGLKSLATVPGRLERVGPDDPFSVFVDYAHTDDALRRSIAAVREITPGRVLCVVGAGGDRDRTKRPLLGRAAASADLAIVTSDNPRSEDPEEIITHVLVGFEGSGTHPLAVVDREAAIRQALALAVPGDAVLIAGKGHETVQIVGENRIPFDDRDVVREQLAHGTERSWRMPHESRRRKVVASGQS